MIYLITFAVTVPMAQLICSPMSPFFSSTEKFNKMFWNFFGVDYEEKVR